MFEHHFLKSSVIERALDVMTLVMNIRLNECSFYPCTISQSVGCGVFQCPPNYTLVEEDVPGECCPNRTCVPVTCEVDGVTYKGGEPIPDDDPCTSW